MDKDQWVAETLSEWASYALRGAMDERACTAAVRDIYRLAGADEPFIMVAGSPREAQAKIDGLRVGTVRGNPFRARELVDGLVKRWSGALDRNVPALSTVMHRVTTDLVSAAGRLATSVEMRGWAGATVRSSDSSFVLTSPMWPDIMADYPPHLWCLGPRVICISYFVLSFASDPTCESMGEVGMRDFEVAAALQRLYHSSPWMAWLYDRAAIVCLPPRLHFDRIPTFGSNHEPYRLHSQIGPAVRFPDGQQAFFWRGTPVPEQLITSPASIPVRDVLAERNAELRRSMMECIGYDRVLAEVGAKVIQRDDFGELLEANLNDDMKPARFVRVKDNSTARVYVIRVHPDSRTCREGLARSAGLTIKDYAFGKET